MILGAVIREGGHSWLSTTKRPLTLGAGGTALSTLGGMRAGRERVARMRHVRGADSPR